VRDQTARQILDNGWCRPGCLTATGREKAACECPRCLGLLHGLAADQPVRGSGTRVAALIALIRQQENPDGVDPDDGALIPLAAVAPAPTAGQQLAPRPT